MKIKYTLFFTLALTVSQLFAQQNDIMPQSNHYEWPEDSSVKKKLEDWQDKKFGMIVHWGLYAVPGIMESWTLCSEAWIDRDSTIAYSDYKKWYWGLINDFNPTKFNPEQWAKVGKNAGMKYLVFTTKHHDGFAMFDTKQSDFSIAKGPFANNEQADVAKYVFNAFRKEGFMIGAYFSKPDWHSEYYWWQKYATADRNNNYDIVKYPWRWNKFKNFVYNQIAELMHNYGSVDILWLDGGWVRPLETVNEEVLSWDANIPKWSQNIDMPKIAAMARAAQPGLLMVDRTVHGLYENYQTPEQKIPEKQLTYPWESCMTLGDNWGFVKNEPYKSSSKVIHSLVEIVAKGGSLLLGIGPKPDGTLPPEVENILKEIGKWTSKNGEAIYNTRITDYYHDGKTWFTQSKDNKYKFAVYCIEQDQKMPETITWKGNLPAKGSKLKLISTNTNLNWEIVNNEIKINLPKNLNSFENKIALAFRFESEK